MMVLFISRSQKRALQTTRRILDQFAPRVGNDVWRTVMTQEGVETLRHVLRRSATKDTAVSCQYLHGRRAELLWIVGRRNAFRMDGSVPVQTTCRPYRFREGDTLPIMPAMQALVTLASLLHDIGKCNDAFQAMLRKPKTRRDSIRHEWISCLLFAGLARQGKDDETWIARLAKEGTQAFSCTDARDAQEHSLDGLPPVACLVLWLMLSHHRLPVPGSPEERARMATLVPESPSDMLRRIQRNWGYQKQAEVETTSFSKGLLSSAARYQERLKQAAKDIGAVRPALVAMSLEPGVRLMLILCRLSLMLADYTVSSMDADVAWQGQKRLYANTGRKEDGSPCLRQTLDEHLLRVAQKSRWFLRFASFLPGAERAQDLRALRHKSRPDYAWQDRASVRFRAVSQTYLRDSGMLPGAFLVNMASTGCGKTIGNAKLLRALSEDGDSFRYSVLLGLRSLTLQTGDAYREQLSLSEDDLAVMIGSAAVRELHEQARGGDATKASEDDPEPCLSNVDDVLEHRPMKYPVRKETSLLLQLLSGKSDATCEKSRAFVETPVLVATIDHMMPATEATHGGRGLLPLLRLMTSDLILDELDDFDKDDICAISRLVHLAGMLGRSVVLSSATMPPDLVRGMAHAYLSGWRAYQSLHGTRRAVLCGWCDEFQAQADILQPWEAHKAMDTFCSMQDGFVQRRVKNLHAKQPIRRAAIFPVEAGSTLSDYAARYLPACCQLHDHHSFTDTATGKRVSIGVIRVAHIRFCVFLAEILRKAAWPDGYEPRILVYHSNQTLLLRQREEQYLDEVLHRKGEPSGSHEVTDAVMRKRIDRTDAENVLFIVVATPVEEVGRDHDFDWAVIEPSSYRSIIQMAGRVQRHRIPRESSDVPNIFVMERNERDIRNKQGSHSKRSPAYCRPGYESAQHMLVSHDLKKLIPSGLLEQGIDSCPRIQRPENLDAAHRLIDLEHLVMQEFAEGGKEADELAGWLDTSWYLTGVPQALCPFRKQTGHTVTLYLGEENGHPAFFEPQEHGEAPQQRMEIYRIGMLDAPPHPERIWLPRDYQDAIRMCAREHMPHERDAEELTENDILRAEQRYGELSFLQDDGQEYGYHDDLGLYPKEGEDGQ